MRGLLVKRSLVRWMSCCIVIATLAAVVFVGFVLGRICKYFGQPPVIGEVIAGIMLGPSLLGAISPEALELLIPSAASDPKGQVPAALRAVSQLGVILYMFLVGLELNAARLAGRAHAAVSCVAREHCGAVCPRRRTGVGTLPGVLA